VSQKWQIIYYLSPAGEIPVRDFLNKCLPKTKAKAFRIFLTIKEYGLQPVIPRLKKLTGIPLWEIRILGKENVRILYATKVGRKILLLHAFYKKKQKTPQKEIKTALERLKQYST
jgi:phage-related protein